MDKIHKFNSNAEFQNWSRSFVNSFLDRTEKERGNVCNCRAYKSPIIIHF